MDERASGSDLLAVLGLARLRDWLASRWRRGERRANPYVVGAPVLDAELFCGREELLVSLLAVVRHTNILLHGERRIGKTSILHHLKRRLETLEDPEYSFHPVLVDLQGVREERLFATVAEEIEAELGPILPRFAARQGRAPRVYWCRDLLVDLRAAIAELDRRSTGKARLVLLIDEVDELSTYDPAVNRGLRDLLSASYTEPLGAVVSGVEVARQWAESGSPWSYFFANVEVGALDTEAAQGLVRRPIRGSLRLDQGVADLVCFLTDCKPHQVQRLCASLVDRAHENRRRRLTLADVVAVWRKTRIQP